MVSTFKNKKDTFSDELVSKDPKRYAQGEHQSNVSNTNIPTTEENVNTQNSIPENKADDEYMFAVESGNITQEDFLTDTKR